MIAIVEVLYTENRSVVHVAGREEDKIRVVGRKRERESPHRGQTTARGIEGKRVGEREGESTGMHPIIWFN